MRYTSRTIAILGATLLAQRSLSGDSAGISNAVEITLARYQNLCVGVVERITEVCTETNVVDVTPIYFAGWIHATNSIPIMLDIIDLPGANEFGKRLIAKRIPGSPINPIAILSGPFPPASPTPASGALAALPVNFSTLTNLITQSGQNTNRAEKIAWAAMARFGNSFGTVLEQNAQGGYEPWAWIQGFGPMSGRRNLLCA